MSNLTGQLSLDDFYRSSDVEKTDESSDMLITNPFDPAKIDITQKSLTIDLLIKRLKEDEINLLTDFQRKGGLWDVGQQSRLIESLIIRIPLPAFYFDGSNDNNWLVVDGLQRLTTLKRFFIDKDLRLNSMEYVTQFEGFTYDQLPRHIQRRVEETQIIAFIINDGTPEEVKYNIFKRINTGGVPLTPQEIRHALNQGVASAFLTKLAGSEEFLQATCHSIKSDRMEDRDFVLRFLAFTMTPYQNYTPDLENFLNSSMSLLNKKSEKELKQLEEKFKKAMVNSIRIFGDDAFRKRYNVGDTRKQINKALYDTWSVNLGGLNDEQSEMVVSCSGLVKEKFINLMKDKNFDGAISQGTGDPRRVQYRFSKVEKLIREVLT
ncbi:MULTISPECIES: DUF262 domain-containing protein [Brevibacillus]|jgi:hypothetical protein|uniref:GmrSD restriction endonucleases N-terminal domain-containing protein n=1 Tax=Brevibacillus parabrevis TaxID=54914 RepID=A0A4Y3PLS7_BREPA|nr:MULTISPECIES: DUF262 domain-containing protein [Brevibacillus]MBU8713210.1 DUF262 domain-containing protein [Brevibacillus parabrevis]MDH6351537.1 hypothetical protein [Brevibacillus sp. 1238]MED2255709.1 DUF262 domain-containing protein [Brevibacillus parabrevis]RNB97416.1 DUF262 domain-containing protein [Brevibacillus parabrevis]WDV95409.1 DUF262 domain-containing protein [Brevibacillus parabrevis]